MKPAVMHRAGEDRVMGLDAVPEGHRAINDRRAIKVMVRP